LVLIPIRYHLLSYFFELPIYFAHFGSQVTPRGGVGGALKNVDVPLVAYFLFWYVGNYLYNITNKLALKAAGGKVRTRRRAAVAERRVALE